MRGNKLVTGINLMNQDQDDNQTNNIANQANDQQYNQNQDMHNRG